DGGAGVHRSHPRDLDEARPLRHRLALRVRRVERDQHLLAVHQALREAAHHRVHLRRVERALRVVRVRAIDADHDGADLRVRVVEVVRLLAPRAKLPAVGLGGPLHVAVLQVLGDERAPRVHLHGIDLCLREALAHDAEVVGAGRALVDVGGG
ncbi:MAG: hypothetical protein ACK559_32210, partial [bacterium]